MSVRDRVTAGDPSALGEQALQAGFSGALDALEGDEATADHWVPRGVLRSRSR